MRCRIAVWHPAQPLVQPNGARVVDVDLEPGSGVAGGPEACGELGDQLPAGASAPSAGSNTDVTDVRVLSRAEQGRQRVEALGLKPATAGDLERAQVALLCVPDKAVPPVAQELARRLGRGAALVHCAGALSLQALGRPRGRATGSFHPLCAVSDPRDSLAGHTVALSTRSPALKATLGRMAKELGLRALEVPEAHRAAYHAGAVLSAGGAIFFVWELP